ncbi:TetR/AcrR family transcriptional regulator [Dictyobacter aurantiacus]|uniref:HTH tetR-type domain-containing protein n=1 Tax=Dictyobacter aurantiacus TaxID=1936993 RepID=A0A401ZFN3_9CHLR|nr:TetR/AcrR family transcriptional regulator [Dictyobacter aurantiacus]GCE05694.1 hypothetical protein KDAU_30230 [Dictyobacter aurantiacus]
MAVNRSEKSGPQSAQVAARERVLEVADQLFATHGYQAVSLRDIGASLSMRHASLYYHFPRGKEELYVAVVERRMRSYQTQLEQVLRDAGADWRQQLSAAAHWMLTQPHMHLGRMMQSDMPAISEESADTLRVIVRDALLQPLTRPIQQALVNNPEKRRRSVTYAGMFLSLIEGIENLPANYLTGNKDELVDVVIDFVLHGLTT